MPSSDKKLSSETAALKKEIAALKKELARMQKEIEALKAPRRVETKLVVTEALEIQNSSGERVASMDHKGHLFCRLASFGAEPGKGDIRIDGIKHKRISAPKIELAEPEAKTPTIELHSEAGGFLRLRDPASKQQLLLQGSGHALIVQNAENGEPVIILSGSSGQGGHLHLRSASRSSKARAVIGVSDLTKAGAILLTNEKNQTVGKLPGDPPEAPKLTVSE